MCPSNKNKMESLFCRFCAAFCLVYSNLGGARLFAARRMSPHRQIRSPGWRPAWATPAFCSTGACLPRGTSPKARRAPNTYRSNDPPQPPKTANHTRKLPHRYSRPIGTHRGVTFGSGTGKSLAEPRRNTLPHPGRGSIAHR